MSAIFAMIAFCLSTIISAIILVICWRQLCCISNMRDINKLNRTIFVVIWVTFGLILNTLLYMVNMYSNSYFVKRYNVFKVCYMIEAFLIISGIHMFRVLAFSFTQQLYMNAKFIRPKWITISLYFAQIIICIALFICYLMGIFFYGNVLFVHIFYIILSVTMFCIALAALIIIRPLAKMLHAVTQTDDNRQKIKASIRAIKMTQGIIIIVCVCCIIHTFFDIEFIYGYLQFDKQLLHCILHSMYLSVLQFGFMVLVSELKKDLCYVSKYSMCYVCATTHQRQNPKLTQNNTAETENNYMLLTETPTGFMAPKQTGITALEDENFKL
eukprot:525355_1